MGSKWGPKSPEVARGPSKSTPEKELQFHPENGAQRDLKRDPVFANGPDVVCVIWGSKMDSLNSTSAGQLGISLKARWRRVWELVGG